MKRLGAVLVGVTLVAVGCSTQPFQVDAVATLRAAARHTLSADAATLRGSMVLNGREIVTLTGTIDVRDGRASITSADAHRPARYPPFESRFVDGSTYVGIDSAVRRPRLLSPSANWVAFEGVETTDVLPVPDRAFNPGFVFNLLEQLRDQPIADARFLAATAEEPTRMQFRLPELETDPLIELTYTVALDSSGRVDGIEGTARAVDGPTPDLQCDAVTLAWVPSVPVIEAPAADEVQRLTPGENLYATTTTLPSFVPPAPPGSLGESDAAAGNKALFDLNRAELTLSLRAQPDPKLSGFSFDPTSNTIDVAYVYAHPERENRSAYDAFAWHVGTVLSDSFWFPQLVQAIESEGGVSAWLPRLHIQLDRVAYECPASAQIAVDAHRITQHDWLQKCAA